MNAPGPSTIALVVGKHKAGKTFLVKRGLARLPRFVVWDVRGEYAHPELGVPGARLWLDLAAWRDHLVGGGNIGREVFACRSSEFEAWCKWIARTGNLLVVLEEIGRYCPGGKAKPALLELIERSRHCNVDLVFTTARVARVPLDLRAQVDELLLSRVTEPTDCAYLKSWLGGPAVARVTTLETHHFVRIRQP